MNSNRYPQGVGDKGSKKWIQELVNHHGGILDAQIREAGLLAIEESISWVSPQESDQYAEYRDEGFLEALGLQGHTEALRQFWPRRGPQWDALGVERTKPRYFIVEAKANVPEITSNCQAEDPDSIRLIEASLTRTQRFLGIEALRSWADGFYQYANRIAHLYFLREIVRIDAVLVMTYFENDNTHLPTSHEEWLGALTLQKKLMGLGRHKLQKYICEVFVDTKSIEDNRPSGSSLRFASGGQAEAHA